MASFKNAVNILYNGNDRGVTPVVAVILMVAVTIVISASVGAVVFGETEGLDEYQEQFEDVLDGEEDEREGSLEVNSFEIEDSGERRVDVHPLLDWELAVEWKDGDPIEDIDEVDIIVPDSNEEITEYERFANEEFAIELNGEEVGFDGIEYSSPHESGDFVDSADQKEVLTIKFEEDITLDAGDEMVVETANIRGFAGWLAQDNEGVATGHARVEITDDETISESFNFEVEIDD